MKNLIIALSATIIFALSAPAQNGDWIDSAATRAAEILVKTATGIEMTGQFPRSLFTDYSLEQLQEQTGKAPTEFPVELIAHPSIEQYRQVRMCDYSDWTSGFFPGSLWYAYMLTGNKEAEAQAKRFTNMLLPVSFMTDTHDLGFMINCSYGNAYLSAPDDSIKAVIVRTADNLLSRYNQQISAIRSWDFGHWNYPVIIDNMMNLELLFNASRFTGDNKYKDTAIKHADKTMKNHFRNDYTSYHVVSYNSDGSIESRGTFQGHDDESAWSRGQGWALYGYAECFRETGIKEFQDHAISIADMIISRNKTDDLIPLWDFDAPDVSTTPRDASAGAVIASGMLDLAYQLGEKGKKYEDYAARMLKSLASSSYSAPLDNPHGFVLEHSTGSLPHGSEIDTPLNYADYYYLEALYRYKRMIKGLCPVETVMK